MKAVSRFSYTRARIMEAADHLFYKEGVRATGTEKIMSLSDVTKSTFYRHFPSKDDLVIAYLAFRDRSFFEAVAEADARAVVRLACRSSVAVVPEIHG